MIKKKKKLVTWPQPELNLWSNTHFDDTLPLTMPHYVKISEIAQLLQQIQQNKKYLHIHVYLNGENETLFLASLTGHFP